MTSLVYSAFDLKKPLYEDEKEDYETEAAMLERIRRVGATPLPVVRMTVVAQPTAVIQPVANDKFVNLEQILNSLESSIDKSLFSVNFEDHLIKYGPVTFGEPYYSRVLGLQGLIRPMHDYIAEAQFYGKFDFGALAGKSIEVVRKIREFITVNDDIAGLAKYFGYDDVTVDIVDGFTRIDDKRAYYKFFTADDIRCVHVPEMQIVRAAGKNFNYSEDANGIVFGDLKIDRVRKTASYMFAGRWVSGWEFENLRV